MNLYEVLSDQDQRYDGFDSALVYAASEDEARQMVVDKYLHPDGTPKNRYGPRLGDPNRFTVERLELAPGVLHISELG